MFYMDSKFQFTVDIISKVIDGRISIWGVDHHVNPNYISTVHIYSTDMIEVLINI